MSASKKKCTFSLVVRKACIFLCQCENGLMALLFVHFFTSFSYFCFMFIFVFLTLKPLINDQLGKLERAVNIGDAQFEGRTSNSLDI